MFGCVGSEVTATIVGRCMHNNNLTACSWFVAPVVLFFLVLLNIAELDSIEHSSHPGGLKLHKQRR